MGGSDSTMCQHLYQGHGAVDTIVRLPESVRLFVHKADTILTPHAVRKGPFCTGCEGMGARRPVHTCVDRRTYCPAGWIAAAGSGDHSGHELRGRKQYQVRVVAYTSRRKSLMHIHRTGTVNLAIKGANVPGVNSILANDTSASQRRSRLNKRQLSNFVADATNCTPSTILPAHHF